MKLHVQVDKERDAKKLPVVVKRDMGKVAVDKVAKSSKSKKKKESSSSETSSSEELEEDSEKGDKKLWKKKDEDPSSEDSSSTSSSDRSRKGRSKRHRTRKGPRKWLIPEKFDGTTPLNIFLGQFESCAKYNKWSLNDKVTHLRISLKGNDTYIIDDGAFATASYVKLVTRLKNQFGEEGQSSLYQSQMHTRRRRPKETLQMLYYDVSRMAGLGYPGKGSRHRDLAATETFIEALMDGNIRMRIRNKEPKSLDHALKIALLAEAN